MRPLSQRERRLVAIGLLFGAIAVVWLGLVSPVIGGFQARAARREELLARYENNRRQLTAIPTLRAEALAQRRSAALYQITAPSESQAAEALKQRLATALTEAGGTVSSAQQVPAEAAGGWVSVRADAQINLTQLDVSIRRLENEPPHVVVDYVSIGAGRAAQTGHAGALDVRLQISALVRPAAVR